LTNLSDEDELAFVEKKRRVRCRRSEPPPELSAAILSSQKKTLRERWTLFHRNLPALTDGIDSRSASFGPGNYSL
jgi:hypothetical protein